MSNYKLILAYGVVLMIVSTPFSAIHLLANPDDAPITPIQHLMAAVANFFGPWGVLIVQWVDFPNAGLRSFSGLLAFSLSILGGLLIGMPLYINGYVKTRYVQYPFLGFWFLFLWVWFTVGLIQIADGLL